MVLPDVSLFRVKQGMQIIIIFDWLFLRRNYHCWLKFSWSFSAVGFGTGRKPIQALSVGGFMSRCCGQMKCVFQKMNEI